MNKKYTQKLVDFKHINYLPKLIDPKRVSAVIDKDLSANQITQASKLLIGLYQYENLINDRNDMIPIISRSSLDRYIQEDVTDDDQDNSINTIVISHILSVSSEVLSKYPHAKYWYLTDTAKTANGFVRPLNKSLIKSLLGSLIQA